MNEFAVLRKKGVSHETHRVPPLVHRVLSSGRGHPLDHDTCVKMESRFGYDFGRVRVHDYPEAVESARALDGTAYTVGRDIVLGAAEHARDSNFGSQTLAHELTHVIQQGAVAPTTFLSGPNRPETIMSQADDPEEIQAKQVAAGITSGKLLRMSAIAESIEPRIMRETPPPPVITRGSSGLSEARGTSGELGMGFVGYPVKEGWAFLDGPGGAAGHRWNEEGFDGVAFRVSGPFEIHSLDNKSLASGGPVRSATALTKNLASNLDNLVTFASQAKFNDVPRIDQVRKSLQATRAAILAGKPIPSNVKLIVTNFGGRSTGISAGLAAQGVTFRDLMGATILGPTGLPARGTPQGKQPIILGPTGSPTGKVPPTEPPEILGPRGKPARLTPPSKPSVILGPTGQPARGPTPGEPKVILGPTGKPVLGASVAEPEIGRPAKPIPSERSQALKSIGATTALNVATIGIDFLEAYLKGREDQKNINRELQERWPDVERQVGALSSKVQTLQSRSPEGKVYAIVTVSVLRGRIIMPSQIESVRESVANVDSISVDVSDMQVNTPEHSVPYVGPWYEDLFNAKSQFTFSVPLTTEKSP